MTNISIITNFGCAANCWYCVWKQHPLRQHFQNVENTDWKKLENFLKTHKHKNKVSISGGGDPLYQFTENQIWWEQLINLCKKHNLLIDIHTREKLKNDNFWKFINRCSFSSDQLKNDIQYLKYLTTLTKTRITHVVTSQTKPINIEEYINFCTSFNAQFTLKELFKFNDHQRYQQLKNQYPNLFYLDHNDYNLYYMPNNTITTKFL